RGPRPAVHGSTPASRPRARLNFEVPRHRRPPGWLATRLRGTTPFGPEPTARPAKRRPPPPYADAVPAEIEPPELARLGAFSERARTDDWSLRSALVLYALPQPQRVNDILVHVRRVDRELGKQSKRLARDGAELWGALESGADGDDLVALLRA